MGDTSLLSVMKKRSLKNYDGKNKYGFSPRRIDESIKSLESQNIEFKPARGRVEYFKKNGDN